MSLKYSPTVFLKDNEYQIFVSINEPAIVWIEVGDKRFRDDVNGTLRSLSLIRRISVPKKLLDKAGKYVVCTKALLAFDKRSIKLDMPSRVAFYFNDASENPSIIRDIIYDPERTQNIDTPDKNTGVELCRAELYRIVGRLSKHVSDVRSYYEILDACSESACGSIPCVFADIDEESDGSIEELLYRFDIKKTK